MFQELNYLQLIIKGRTKNMNVNREKNRISLKNGKKEHANQCRPIHIIVKF